MKPFEYAAPRTLDEAVALLSEGWGETEVLAGGTDLITSLKQGITSPNRVVSLKQLSALKGVVEDGHNLRIGAMTTLAELAEHPAVKQHFPALVTAAEGVNSLQILALGTVGGDLCQRPRCWYFRNRFGLFGQQDGISLVREGDNRYHSIFETDQPALFVSASSLGPGLIALGATMTAVGPEGKRRQIPAAEFFRTPADESERETALQPNEILTEIRIPIRGLKNATYEVRHRDGLDWPYVTASVAFRSASSGASDAMIVLGHVAPTPRVARAAADALDWQNITAATAEQCGQKAAEGAKPLSGNAYKVPLVKTAVKRAILAAAGIQKAL